VPGLRSAIHPVGDDHTDGAAKEAEEEAGAGEVGSAEERGAEDS